MPETMKLKDHFTADVVRAIGERIAAHHEAFDLDAYVARVLTPDGGTPFADLEFTDRTRRIADAIDLTCGLEPVALLDLLVRSLPPELGSTDGPLNDGFMLWPYGDVIARHGADHPVEGLVACYELTTRFTAEFAIRPILAAHPSALATVGGWTADPSEHVRRLVSEGTRPRLPWAPRLRLPLDEVLPILTRLRADPSPYVRRSVANHLNDLVKDHPERIIDLLAGWHRDAVADEVDETQWIVRHALRNQLKHGNPAALAIFGFAPPSVDVDGLEVTPSDASIGDTVTLRFVLRSTSARPQRLLVDLVMGYVKANGSRSPKVFRYRELTLDAGADHGAEKRFPMVERSTRRLYPGRHTLAVRVNGVDLAETGFDLA